MKVLPIELQEPHEGTVYAVVADEIEPPIRSHDVIVLFSEEGAANEWVQHMTEHGPPPESFT